jgi:class 3 adenylate cyclase/pimeloyl-ACP methyl ester carboxylesterase
MSTPADLGAGAATRELAAIMFSDIAGYTFVMGRDEDKALRALAEHREVLRGVLPKFNGRMIGEIGDGTLSSFHSALDAVNCAREVQASLKDEPEMRLRIGIHVGDVLFKDNTVLGDGVNVASRIHALAPPGGICISDRVYDEIRNKPEISVKDLGEQTLKNVSRPIRVYAMAVPGIKFDNSVAPEFRATRATRILNRRQLLFAVAAVILATTAMLYVTFRAEIATDARIYLPRLISTGLKQTLGYCTTADGVRIAYGTVGKGPPVVFVMGSLTDVQHGSLSPMYAPAFISPIAARHQVVQYDGRGFGMSDRGVRDYSLEARLRDLEAVLDALKLKRFALLGIGEGGSVSIAYTVRHSERVTRLALLGTYAFWDPTLLNPSDRRRQEPFYSLIEQRWDDPAFRQMFVSLMMPDGSEVDKSLFAELVFNSSTSEDHEAFETADDKIDARSIARQVRAPTIVMHLRGDRIVPLEFGSELADLIPGARFVIIEGRDKMPVPGDGETEQMLRVLIPFFDADLPKQAGAAGQP